MNHLRSVNYRILGLLAVGFDRYGSEEAFTNNAIQHLYQVYVSINADVARELEESNVSATDTQAKEFFRRMEEGHTSTSRPTCISSMLRFRQVTKAQLPCGRDSENSLLRNIWRHTLV